MAVISSKDIPSLIVAVCWLPTMAFPAIEPMLMFWTGWFISFTSFQANYSMEEVAKEAGTMTLDERIELYLEEKARQDGQGR